MILINILNVLISFFTSSNFLVLLGLVTFTLILLYFYLTRHFGYYEKKYGVPGLKPVPFFGTEQDFLLGRKNVNDCIYEKYNAFKGHRFGITYQGMRPALFIRDIELAKKICISDFNHFTDFFGDNIDSIVDNNIFFMNGEKWKISKATLSQVFRVKYIKNVLPKINFCITRSMKQLDSYARTGEDLQMDEKVVDICLVDIVGHAACGVDIDAAKDSTSEFTKMIQLFQSSVWRFILLNVAPEFMVLFGIQVFYPKATKYFEKLLKQLMVEHKAKQKYDDIMGVHLKVQEEIEKKKSDPNTLSLDHHLLTDDMILSSCMQFFLDGVVLSAAMIEVAVFFLARDQELQERVYEEIKDVLGDRMTSSEGDEYEDLPSITDNDLMEMKLVDQIFSESSRFATVPFIFRTCTKEYKIPGSDFVVPKGMPIYMPTMAFHMDPEYFPEPEKFKPERFSPQNKDNITSGTFGPFGLGPRMCLGMNFIRMECKAYIANLIRSFRIHPSEKGMQNLVWSVEFGKIKGGLWVKIEKR